MAGILGATNITPGFRRAKFSRLEIRDLLISTIVLSIAFTIVMVRGLWGSSNIATVFALYFAISLVLVTVSFITHELAHKFVAQKYGAWSEYRMSLSGLLFSVAISFMGFLIAAPGAVYINGRINESQNGKISAAGPMVNIIIAAVAVLLCYFTSGLTLFVIAMIAYLNSILAIFNLIPFPPLDGSKIVRWNKGVWVAMIATGIIEAMFVYFVIL